MLKEKKRSLVESFNEQAPTNDTYDAWKKWSDDVPHAPQSSRSRPSQLGYVGALKPATVRDVRFTIRVGGESKGDFVERMNDRIKGRRREPVRGTS